MKGRWMNSLRRGQLDSNSVSTINTNQAIHNFETQSATVLNTPPVGVGSNISHIAQKFVNKIAISAMQFLGWHKCVSLAAIQLKLKETYHPIKSCKLCHLCRMLEELNNLFRILHRSRGNITRLARQLAELQGRSRLGIHFMTWQDLPSHLGQQQRLVHRQAFQTSSAPACRDGPLAQRGEVGRRLESLLRERRLQPSSMLWRAPRRGGKGHRATQSP